MTPSASTPSGGMHLFYEAPKAYRNRVAIEGTAIDIRAEGGYVILPGHKNGRRWINKLRTTPLAPAPAWLDIALKETLSASGFPCLPSSSSAPLEREQALATLKRACARIIAAPEGAQEHIRTSGVLQHRRHDRARRPRLRDRLYRSRRRGVRDADLPRSVAQPR